MPTAASAPGKALLAGGYLVLEPQYPAYATALSARMHAVIEPGRGTVASPQFGGAWTFDVKSRMFQPKNPFLTAVFQTVMDYLSIDTIDVAITIFSDPGFHTTDNTTEKFSFLFHSQPIEKVAKTGLGSSAGLVTVVSAVLLSHLTKRPIAELRDKIHNVAQVAHCAAQGKIGLGFDVAAAVYGSIIYQRFDPKIIESNFGLKELIDSLWLFRHDKCVLPKKLKLLMGDIKGGSETPKLVSQVMAWRKADAHSGDLYARLNAANKLLMAALTANDSKGISSSLRDIRSRLQELTAKSGAPIEPPEQTALLDECEGMPGCLGGVVPGAGGYDAICLIVEADKVGKLKEASEHLPVQWLELSEEAEGLREEDPGRYLT